MISINRTRKGIYVIYGLQKPSVATRKDLVQLRDCINSLLKWEE